jgi:hypothetical protein
MRKKRNGSILKYSYADLRWMKKMEKEGWKSKETH